MAHFPAPALRRWKRGPSQSSKPHFPANDAGVSSPGGQGWHRLIHDESSLGGIGFYRDRSIAPGFGFNMKREVVSHLCGVNKRSALRGQHEPGLLVRRIVLPGFVG